MKDKAKSKRMLLTGVLSALFYGIWAYYVNYGLPTVVVSSAAQSICSFFGGYLVSALVELTFTLVKKPWRFPVSAFIPYALTLSVYALVHKLVGTPDILATIMPNIIVGTPYFVIYCLKLEKNEEQRFTSTAPDAT